MPENCPSCGTKLLKSEGEVLLRCPNKNCFAQKKQNFYHFASRSAFNIDGLGPKIIDKLLDFGLVSDPADLFELKIGDILNLESLPRGEPKRALRGFADKSAKNLIKSISEKKEITLEKFIYGLGIRNIGEETAIDLAKYFSSTEKIKNAKLEEFDSISDIGPVMAKSVYAWFQDKENIKFLDKLQKFVSIKHRESNSKQQKLSEKTFVVTGSLESMSREEAKSKIRDMGGSASESVSSKTDYVVMGNEPGSKAEKAKKLGVKILSEKEFLELIS